MYTMSDLGCFGLNIITGNVAILILHSYMSSFSVMSLGKRKLHFVMGAQVNEARASDEELEAPIEDQPLPADASPTALSPGYIADFNPEEDEDPEEDPADHPDTEHCKTDESASTTTPPTSSTPHIILYSKTKPVEYGSSDEELEAPMEDQPLPADASPTALSPGYIADFDQKEDEEDLEEDHADHPIDGGDNDDNDSSDDDDDDDDVVKDEEDEEEEEHLAPTDPSAETMTTVNQGMSVEEIEQVVAQRVANAIEAVAIYETKNNMGRKSMSQTK
ncbi:hypothetical protein Tco_0415615 [Tanacetum coccineum]